MIDHRAVGEAAARLKAELSRTIVGYEDVIDDLLVSLVAHGHVLLEGVPGVAKTSLAKGFAAASGLTYARIQFTQDLLPADITGHFFFHQKTQEFELRRGPVFTNVLLADEINRSPPKTQSALLEAMEERQVTIEGRTYALPRPFVVIATMNPIDVEGVYKLPEAQLDRFLVRSRMAYLPPETELRMLASKVAGANGAPTAAMLPTGFFEAAATLAGTVRVDPAVLDYLHRVCLATRDDPGVVLGASPRAMEQLLRATRARALLDGRGYTIPDDVKAEAPKVLNHRLILDVEAELSGRTVDAILADILGRVGVPKVEA